MVVAKIHLTVLAVLIFAFLDAQEPGRLEDGHFQR